MALGLGFIASSSCRNCGETLRYRVEHSQRASCRLRNGPARNQHPRRDHHGIFHPNPSISACPLDQLHASTSSYASLASWTSASSLCSLPHTCLDISGDQHGYELRAICVGHSRRGNSLRQVAHGRIALSDRHFCLVHNVLCLSFASSRMSL